MSKSNSEWDGWPHPSTFPVGSPESRAAARAFAEGRNKPDEQFLLRIVFIAGENIPEKRASHRFVDDQGKTVEWVIIKPDDTTPEYREYRARVGLE
jgi:hypothetical protein